MEPQHADPWAEFRARPGGPANSEAFAMGLTDPIHGGAQMLAHSLPTGAVDAVNSATRYVNELPVVGPVTRALGMTPATTQQIDEGIQTREADYQARRGPDAGIDWHRMAGVTAGTLPLAAVGGAPAGVVGAAARGAVQGATSGAMMPVTEGDFATRKAQQVVMGGLVGAPAGAAGHLIGRAMAPQVSPAVRELSDAGVELTPGQMMGRTAQSVESKLQSIPIVGDAIRNASNRSLESFNIAAANQALRPIGVTVPGNIPAGRPLAEFVAQQVDDAYAQAHRAVTPFRGDGQFINDMRTAAQKISSPQLRQQFLTFLQDKIASRTGQNGLDGAGYQAIKSDLGGLASEFRRSTTAFEREVGNAYQAAQNAFRDLLGRTQPEQVVRALRAVDQAHAGALRVTGAAAGGGAAGSPAREAGVFTAAELSNSVRNLDSSLRHGRFARGEAMMQNLSDAGRQVLPSAVANSGTTDRAMLAAILAGQFGGAPAVAGMGAGAAAYSAPVTRAMQAWMLRQPSPLVRELAAAAGRGGALVAAPLVASPAVP